MTNTWYKMPVAESRLAQSFEAHIQTNLEIQFVKNGAPPEVAVFAAKMRSFVPEQTRAHSYCFVYFSPKAVEFFRQFISRFSGTRCGAPLRSEVKFLAGDDKLYETLK